ncbi:MAG: hypothetical protein QOC69_6797 [Mycobacterium sp.]|nr:hypothetical protein [Mycobacterium sp.]
MAIKTKYIAPLLAAGAAAVAITAAPLRRHREYNLRAVAGECGCGLEADAGVSAGDDRDAIGLVGDIGCGPRSIAALGFPHASDLGCPYASEHSLPPFVHTRHHSDTVVELPFFALTLKWQSCYHFILEARHPCGCHAKTCSAIDSGW